MKRVDPKQIVELYAKYKLKPGRITLNGDCACPFALLYLEEVGGRRDDCLHWGDISKTLRGKLGFDSNYTNGFLAGFDYDKPNAFNVPDGYNKGTDDGRACREAVGFKDA